MPKQDDFSWEKGKIKDESSLGKIVSIPTQVDKIEAPEDIKSRKTDNDYVIVDEFKKKVAEVLSKELHEKK